MEVKSDVVKISDSDGKLKPIGDRFRDLLALVNSERNLKPSILLKTMRPLTEATNANERIEFSNKVWKLLFTEALPAAIRANVAALPVCSLSLDELALETDKFYEAPNINRKKPGSFAGKRVPRRKASSGVKGSNVKNLLDCILCAF